MSTMFYGTSVFVSRPRYDQTIVAWHAYASVCRDVDTFDYHQLHLEETFQTEKEALAFGYAEARTWNDEQNLNS